MKYRHVVNLFKGLCPPLLWQAVRPFYLRVVPPPLPFRFVSTLAEVDAEFDRLRPLELVSYDAFYRGLASFRLQPPPDLPPDPHSPEYRDAQMNLYRQLSGRASYVVEQCEQMEFDDDHRLRPFPYYTRSGTIIGEQMMAIGFVLRAMQLNPGGRVLEFGSGYGKLTVEMARSSYQVTGVDLNPCLLALIEDQCRRLGLETTLVCSGMLDYRPVERFDRVVFYESFHHCHDHAAMVARLDEMVAPDGAVLFAGEPIEDNFPMPWGLRLDGKSLWAIRHHGWLELGFRTDYFLDLLARHGWTAEILTSADVPWQRVLVARRAPREESP